MIRTSVKYVEGGITYNKLCTGCHVMQPISRFGVNNRNRDGRGPQCRTCCLEHSRNNKEYDHEKYLNNRETILEQRKEYRETHKEEIVERKRIHYINNREKILEQHRKYDIENKEQVAKHKSKYYQDNKEEAATRSRVYRSKNKDVFKSIRQRRRARKRNNGSVEYFRDLEIFERDGWICQICKLPVDPALPHHGASGKINIRSKSLDHIIPLARGGTHTRANVQLAHLGCNITKSAKIIGEVE